MLNTRQWKLYEYLKKNSDRYVNREEILNDAVLRAYYPLSKNTTQKNDRYDMRMLTADIQELKNDGTIQVVILSNKSKGIKIASEEEYYQSLLNEKISLLKRLSLNYKQMSKASLNNQQRVVLNHEKSVIESFIV